MARTYAYDAQAAAEATSGGKRITEHGHYKGKFKFAWAETNQNGTESVNFIFESDTGQQAGPLPLYTHKGDGTELYSFKTLQAIIGCLRLKGIKPQPGSVTLWDYDAKSEVSKQKDIFPALMGRPVGVILTTEDYVGNDGKQRTRLLLSGAFTADTEQMANELDRNENGGFQKYLEWMTKANRWHKSLKNAPAANQAYGTETQYTDDDFGDSFP